MPEHPALSPAQATELLALCEWAIRSRWEPVFHAELAARQGRIPLAAEPIACFVTLHKAGRLRGCIGCLQADMPLAEALVHYAQAAAFSDPRFPPLTAAEWPDCTLSLSLLGPLQPLQADSEAALLSQLRPGIDGLWLQDERHSATFLPAVWRELPDAHQFVQQLLRKGHWLGAPWSSELRASRYQVLELTADQSQAQ